MKINVLNRILAFGVRFLLGLRYRIEVKGLKAVRTKGRRGIVFLPNHPALIDPIILLALLYGKFRPRAWAVEHQIDRPVIGRLAGRLGVLPFPAVGRDPDRARRTVEKHIQTTVSELKKGENFLLYPSGHAYRNGKENLRGNSAAYTVLQKSPGARAVLVRITGLWGSSFSWAHGHAPRIGHRVKKSVKNILLNFFFFGPRRNITIEFVEDEDLPVNADREEFNSFLENFYNVTRHPPIYVPYTLWERGGRRELPEPDIGQREKKQKSKVPPDTEQRVKAHLREISGVKDIESGQYLGKDLGIDSIGRAELLAWVALEWGRTGGDAETVQTVGDLMLVASGRAPAGEPAEIRVPGAKWWKWHERYGHRLAAPKGDSCGTSQQSAATPKPYAEPASICFSAAGTINQAFVDAAKKASGAPIVADQVSGVLKYRRMLTAIFALKTPIENLPGKRVGIMLPATAGAGVVYMATLFAGKTPVMLNWTLGARGLKHCLKVAEVEKILTAKALTDRLKHHYDIDVSTLSEYFIFLSELRKKIGKSDKIVAMLRAIFNPQKLTSSLPDPGSEAVILFTSGSESFPKAVPLTHKNILNNIQDITQVMTIRPDDCLLGMLPPFHSFGLTVTLILPLCTGVRTVYYPDPTDGGTLGQIIDTYGVNLLVGTPTFLEGILKAPAPASLSSLRLAVSGAEECPESTYDTISERCPDAVILEGYGITECSPVVSVNDEKAPRRQTIGKLLPSFEHAIVDVGTWKQVGRGERGMLLLRGPSVFKGYLPQNGQRKDPFVEFEGRKWYETGDLVREDEKGVLEFCGRLKRFVKIGGEMISLPAVEEVLKKEYPSGKEVAQVAVDAVERAGRPQIILFSTRRDIDRQKANSIIKNSGLSPLHNIKHVQLVEEIPLLGTGKTDYRQLADLVDF